VETACTQAAQYATVPVPPAVTHGLVAFFSAFPAVLVALLAWRSNKKEWADQLDYLRGENEKLADNLRLALYARGPHE
jgi:hypothetical protein